MNLVSLALRRRDLPFDEGVARLRFVGCPGSDRMARDIVPESRGARLYVSPALRRF